MTRELAKKIEKNPSFVKLVKRRSRFAWRMTIAMLLVYYAFILTIAFAPEVLAQKIGNGVLTLGIPVGIAIIIFSFIMAGVYTFRANGEFDDLANKVKEDVERGVS